MKEFVEIYQGDGEYTDALDYGFHVHDGFVTFGTKLHNDGSIDFDDLLKFSNGIANALEDVYEVIEERQQDTSKQDRISELKRELAELENE